MAENSRFTPLTPRSSSGPGQRPLTAQTGVRLPYGVLYSHVQYLVPSHEFALQPGFSGLFFVFCACVRSPATECCAAFCASESLLTAPLFAPPSFSPSETTPSVFTPVAFAKWSSATCR